MASGCPVLATWRSRLTPGPEASTMNTATEAGSTRAGTSTASAIIPEGTQDLDPDSVQPSPLRSATTEGASGVPPNSTSAW